MSEQITPETPAPKTESHDPKVPEAWKAFMRTGWGDRELDLPRHPVADHAARRRTALAEAFPGERLVLPAGTYKVRSNDTDYRFRSDTAHTYFSGNQTSDAVLVIEDGDAVLYARPRSSRETDEFFRDRQYGELWAGRRPSLNEMSASLGLPVRHIDELDAALARSGKTRVHRGLSSAVDRNVAGDETRDAELARVASEMRLIKDDWEIGELQQATDITALGFEDSVREWDDVLRYGERWIEGTFFRRARAMGNDIGYDSIVGGGSHATTLHWIDNSGALVPGQMVLLDMGVDGARQAAVHAGLARAAQRRVQLVDVAHGQPERGGHLVQRRTPARPELAVLPVAEELVGVARGARPCVEHRVAVLDDQHGVARLVAGEVRVGRVRAEPVVGVVRPHLVRAGRQHQPLARKRLGQRGASARGVLGDGVARKVELPVSPACPHEPLPGLGNLWVVRLCLGGGGLRSGLLAHAVTLRRARGPPRAPDRLPPCLSRAATASPSPSW